MALHPRVIDGDTFETSIETIRFADINAPKGDTPRGRASTAYLKSLIQYRDVILEAQGTGHYGRTLAKVWRKSDSLNISQAMVNAGHASWI